MNSTSQLINIMMKILLPVSIIFGLLYVIFVGYNTTHQLILPIITFISVVITAFIAYKRVSDVKSYEELQEDKYLQKAPYNDSLRFLNYIFKNMGKNVGYDLGLLELIEEKSLIVKKANESVSLVINPEIPEVNDSYKKQVLELFKKYATDGKELSFSNLNMLVIDEEDKSKLTERYNDFRDEYDSFIDLNRVKELFDLDSANKNLMQGMLITAVLSLISIVSLGICMIFNRPVLGVLDYVLSVLMIIIIALIGIFSLMEVLFVTNNKYWTTEGQEYNNKWIQYKNYITNADLFSNNPPRSLEELNKVVQYALVLDTINITSEIVIDYINSSNMNKSDIENYPSLDFVYNGGSEYFVVFDNKMK